MIRENLGFSVEPAYGLELLQLEKGSTGLFAYLKPRIVLLCHYNLKKEGPLALIRRNIFREEKVREGSEKDKSNQDESQRGRGDR